MEYRTLGGTGVKVSSLCLGAMMFGAWGNADHDDSVSIIRTALDAGINAIDTADVYSPAEPSSPRSRPRLATGTSRSPGWCSRGLSTAAPQPRRQAPARPRCLHIADPHDPGLPRLAMARPASQMRDHCRGRHGVEGVPGKDAT
jgi:Aldo/keto reductase family